jgi:hypothetical protein
MATATVGPVSSSSITTRATSATTRSTAKSLLKETMGDASAKRYEYLFDDDDFTLPSADATTVVTTDSPEDSHDDNDDGGGRESYHDEHADHDDPGDSHTTTLRHVERELRASLFRIQQQDELLKRQQQQFQDQHHATQRAIQQCRDVDRKLDVLAQAVVTPLKQQLRAEQQARQQERVKTRQLQELLLQQQQQQQQQEDQPAPASSMQQQQQQQQEYVERTQFQQEQLVLAQDEETKRIVRELVLELEATNQQHQQTIQHMERNFDMERAEWTKKVQDLQRQLRTQTEEAARVVIELRGALEASENSRLEHNLEHASRQGQFASEEDEGVQHHAQEHHQAVTVQKRGKHVASNGVMKLETADDPSFEQQQPPFHGVPVTPDHHHHPTATTTTTLVQSLESNDPDVIQAGIALADSLIELLLQGSRDTEVSVLEQMEVLDQLLGGPETNEEEDAILRSRSPNSLEHCIEEEDDDQGDQDIMYYDELDTRSVEQEQFMLARQGEDNMSDIEHVDEHDQVEDNDETNATNQFQEQEEYEELFLCLFERVRELEQERDFMVQESLDMLEAARLANGLELQFQLAEMKEHMDRTIQIRLMEELQKNRTIHVVPEE